MSPIARKYRYAESRNAGLPFNVERFRNDAAEISPVIRLIGRVAQPLPFRVADPSGF